MAVAATAAVLACAGGATRPAGPGEAPPSPPTGMADAAAGALAEARAAFDSGAYRRAAWLADSLVFAWRDRPAREEEVARALWLEALALERDRAPGAAGARLAELLADGAPGDLRRDAARALARVRIERAEEPAGLRVLLTHPEAVDAERLELARRAADRLSEAELSELLEGARAEPATPDPELLEVLRAARAEAAAEPREPITIGVVLPLSGRFAPVGGELLRGVELALERSGRGEEGMVRLRVVDDGSRSDSAVAALAKLEAEGAVAAIGPVRSEALAGAAAARAYPGFALVSPTATSAERLPAHALSLWVRERREVASARAMASFMADSLDLRRLAVLRPEGEEGRVALRAFRTEAGRRGAWIVAERAYRPDSTTFGIPISELAAYRPEGVFVPAPGARTVLQLGPQLAFFGLRTSVIGGDVAWSEPAVVRRLDPGFADTRLAAVEVDRAEPEPAWASFRAAYEMKYRESLPDNMFAALGHDAMALVLAALPAEGRARPGAVARALGSGDVGAVTGRLERDPVTGELRREVRIRMLWDRSLVAADPLAIRERLRTLAAGEEARRQARRERAAGRAERAWPREPAATDEAGGGP